MQAKKLLPNMNVDTSALMVQCLTVKSALM